jgi:hypothetical protein
MNINETPFGIARQAVLVFADDGPVGRVGDVAPFLAEVPPPARRGS